MTHAIQVRCAACNNYHDAEPNQEFDALMHMACAELDASTAPYYQEWNLTDPSGRWHYEDDTATLCFDFADRRTAAAPYQLVGSYVEEDGTFRWGWDHPGATPLNRRAADTAKAEGERLCAEVLTRSMLKAPMDAIWHVAKITAFLSELPAVYRTKVSEHAWWVVALGTPAWRASA